jgi:hypothetical protein
MRRAVLAAAVGGLGMLGARGMAGAEPWKLTMEGGAEADSNVKQMEGIPGEMSERIAAPVARAGARIDHRDRLLGGAYVLSLSSLARLVASDRGKTENVILYDGDVRWMHAMESRPIALGARILAADALAIAGGTGSRTFRNLGADGVLVLGGGGDRTLTLTVGERELWYKPNPIFNWYGPVTHARFDLVLWQPPDKTRSLELATLFGFEARRYDSSALSNNCPPDAPPAIECSARTSLVRRDRFQRAGVELTWTAAVVVTAGYQLTVIDSNSYGQSLVRHRVVTSATTELFDKLFGTVTATLQIDQYPNGVPVEKAALQEVATLEDENRSSVQVRLARELTPAWSLEARGAIWREFGNADTSTFRRELIYTGVIYAR